jgi:acetyl-CoA carboxylase biotin carboxyl carrier protein
MFTFAELCELIRIVSETRIGGIEVEKDGMRVHIDGVPAAPVLDVRGGAPLLPPQLAVAGQLGGNPIALPGGEAVPAPGGRVGGEAEEEGLSFVTSPIVGTFYAAPSPESEAYVKPGDHVSKGQVLCIVEAMKLMNEIEADVSGVVVKRYPENAQPVEFGERLFAIRVS